MSRSYVTKQQRILAIHDLSGFSHTSLMAVIPICNRLGISVCALPTAILSANTENAGYQLVDMTNHLMAFLNHWSRLKLTFNAIYSGFLSSRYQVEIVIKAIEMFQARNQYIVVDPVMADDGELYNCFDADIIAAMQKLIVHADIITPNLTEATLLLDEKYDNQVDTETVKHYCRRLAETGPGNIVITSVPVQKDLSKTSVICYNRKRDKFDLYTCAYQPVNYPGTGDIFTSIVTGYIISGYEINQAVKMAVTFVSKAIKQTRLFNLPAEEGICLECVINKLQRPKSGCSNA